MGVPTNINNIPGYIGYEEHSFNASNFLNPPSLQDPITFFQNNVNTTGGAVSYNSSGQVVNTATPWTFNYNDVIGAGTNPELQVQLTDNYTPTGNTVNNLYTPSNVNLHNSASILAGPQNYFTTLLNEYSIYGTKGNSAPFDFTYLVNPAQTSDQSINLGNVGMTIAQINAWYQNNSYSQYEWSSNTFWQEPANRQIYVFFQLLSASTGNIPLAFGTYLDTVQDADIAYNPPPTNVQGFLQTLLKAQVVTAGANTASPTLESAVTQTELAPSWAGSSSSISPSQTLQATFGQFLQNYYTIASGMNLGGASVTSAQGFATAWYNYLTESQKPPSTTPSTIPINYVDDSSNPGSVFNISTGNSVPTPSYSDPPATVTSANLGSESTFVNQYVQSLQDDFDTSMGFTTGSQPFASADINLPSGTTNQSLFNANFATFINYVIQGGSTSIPDYNTFIQQWESFVGPTAVLDATGSTTSSQSLLTYSEIYNEFYPSGTPQHGQFLTHLTSFVNGYVGPSGTGLFNPSLMIDQWFKNLVNNVYGTQFVQIPISLDQGNYESVRILNQLYYGLASMVQSLQQMTVAQANRLDFYSKYQQAYTEAMKSVPVFVMNPGFTSNSPVSTSFFNFSSNSDLSSVISSSPIDSTSSDDSKRRADANQLSSQYIENLRSYRNEASSMGDQFQASFSVSNQAVNNETSMATEILQTVNTIAGDIFSQQQLSQQNTP